MKILYLLCMIGFVMACQPATNNRLEYPKGGYPYPTSINPRDKDFYFYPLLDSFNQADSFGWASLHKYIGLNFREPNISKQPRKKEMFRLFRFNAFGGILIISLQQNELEVKYNDIEGDEYISPYPATDTNKLNELEKLHYGILGMYFPIGETMQPTSNYYSPRRKRYLDSLVNLYPELLSPNYYKALIEKSHATASKKFTYQQYKKPISTAEFDAWVSFLNNQGYWQMPFNITDTANHPGYADGYLLLLEANTSKQYNFVQTDPVTLQQYKAFKKICDSLISLSGIKEKL